MVAVLFAAPTALELMLDTLSGVRAVSYCIMNYALRMEELVD